MKALVQFFSAVAALSMGCSESTFFVEPEPVVTPNPGSIEGRVCDPSGRTWLPDAQIYTHIYDSDGVIYDTRTAYSDRDGYWLLDDLPQDNEYTVYVQYGYEILETHAEIWVGDGEHVLLDEPDCFDPLEMEVAVITGDYDDFQDVLADMGFANYDLVDGLSYQDLTAFLGSSNTMETYDIIFFNGGHIEEDVIYDTDDSDTEGIVGDIQENILEYVNEGGNIYASDWAYDIIDQVWPSRVTFPGDGSPDSAQMGQYDNVQAAVSDAAMAEFLGTNYVSIEYDLPVWPPIESVDGSVSVHLTGSVSYKDGTSEYTIPSSPLLISFTSGEGKVVFSTFRVAKNGSSDMLMILQYMMYSL